jgi:hypothetical protein
MKAVQARLLESLQGFYKPMLTEASTYRSSAVTLPLWKADMSQSLSGAKFLISENLCLLNEPGKLDHPASGILGSTASAKLRIELGVFHGPSRAPARPRVGT